MLPGSEPAITALPAEPAALNRATSIGKPHAPWWFAPPASVSGADARWDLLLVCVAGYILTAVGRVHQLFPPIGALRPAMLTGGLAIALYLLDRCEARAARHVLVPTTKYVIALLAWMALSATGSVWRGGSFELLLDNFVKTVLMYIVIVGSVRRVLDVERLAFTYLASAALYAAVVIFRFDLGSGDDWRLGHLYYYDANDFATLAVSAIPVGMYFLHTGRGVMKRWFAACALAILALAFVYTGSRGGFIALVVMSGYVVLRYTGITLRWRLSAMALVAIVVLATASDRYWEQMSTILADADYNRTEETGRLQIWRRGIGYMLQYPVFGVGPASFQTAEGRLSPQARRQQLGIGVRWNAAHNSLIQVGAELGIPGLLMFIAIIVSAFNALRLHGRRRRRFVGPQPRGAQLTHAITAALVGFLVGAFFLSLAYSEMLYVLVALAVGLNKVVAREVEHST
jgi:O-antigen ligase